MNPFDTTPTDSHRAEPAQTSWHAIADPPTPPATAAPPVSSARRPGGRGFRTVLAACVLSATLASASTAALVSVAVGGSGPASAATTPNAVVTGTTSPIRTTSPLSSRPPASRSSRSRQRHVDPRHVAVLGAGDGRRLRRHPHGRWLHPHEQARRRGQLLADGRAVGRHGVPGDDRQRAAGQRPRARSRSRRPAWSPPRSATPHAPGRRDGDRDRQPARDLHRDRDEGHHLGDRPRHHRHGRGDGPADATPRPDPDRRGDQPRQQRRPAARRDAARSSGSTPPSPATPRASALRSRSARRASSSPCASGSAS